MLSLQTFFRLAGLMRNLCSFVLLGILGQARYDSVFSFFLSFRTRYGISKDPESSPCLPWKDSDEKVLISHLIRNLFALRFT